MKLPLTARLLRLAFRSAVPPLSRIADQLEALNRNLQRDMAARGVPELPDEEQIRKLETERAVTEPRDEWEIAVEEEVRRRREAEDREIADRVADRMS